MDPSRFIQDWSIAKDYRLRPRICAFPDCSKQSIGSHVVAKSHLKRIAETGHVISPQHREKAGSVGPGIGPIGITKAPRMNIYCKGHDDQLFAPLEKRGEVTAEVARALLHRARHFELIKKKAFHKVGKIASVRAMISGNFSPAMTSHHQDAWAAGIEISEKNALEADLIVREKRDVYFAEYRIKLPSVICAMGAIGPNFSLDGDPIELGKGQFPFYKTVGVYLFSDPHARLILIGEMDDIPTEIFMDSFKRYPKAKLKAHLPAIAFWMTEDVFLRPSYYEQLPAQYKSELDWYVSNSLIPFIGSSLNSVRIRRIHSAK